MVIGGYFIGLPYGPKGVAFAYSAAMTLWAIPHIAWCVRGTVVSLGDILLTASRPFISGLFAAGLALGVQFLWAQSLAPLPRLVVGSAVLLVGYIGVLFFVMGQKAVYIDIFQKLRARSPLGEKTLVPA